MTSTTETPRNTGDAEGVAKHTPGPWGLCFHLQSAENDASCPCGYRGGIWGPDGERTICEMGSTLIKGEEGLCPPRYARPVELANARLIAAAPILLDALERTAHALELAFSRKPLRDMAETLAEAHAAIAAATQRASPDNRGR